MLLTISSYLLVLAVLLILLNFIMKLVYYLFQNGESSYVLRIYDDEVQAMQSARNVNGVAICGRLAGQSERLKVFVMKQLLHMHSYVNAFLFAPMCTFINNSQSVLQNI